jgi:peptidoglycan hydrolase CwlO-like protein
MALGTTILNLYTESSDERYNNVQTNMTEITETHEEDKAVLHTRISDLSRELDSLRKDYNDLKTNVAVYNANILNLQSDISEIKSDVKRLSEMEIGTAIRNTLRDFSDNETP